MTNTFPLANFTDMAKRVDADAVNGCLASGMVVIVEVDSHGFVAGIVSAHNNRVQARMAYNFVVNDGGHAVIFPRENGPYIFYDYLTEKEFNEFCIL